MFTKQAIQHAIRSRQRHNGFPIASRSVSVNFSLGPRSSLVRLSLVIRQSIEDRSRTERGTSKKRTKEQRISIEMPTRNYRQLDDLPPSWLAEHPSATTEQHTALTLLLPRQIVALSAPLKHSHGESSLFHPFCTFHTPPTAKAPHRL